MFQPPEAFLHPYETVLGLSHDSGPPLRAFHLYVLLFDRVAFHLSNDLVPVCVIDIADDLHHSAHRDLTQTRSRSGDALFADGRLGLRLCLGDTLAEALNLGPQMVNLALLRLNCCSQLGIFCDEHVYGRVRRQRRRFWW